ncbi:MAG: hypothetical protein NC930_05105 [Candidatus Omnitrophica bacterium]|nr:hypothetical protein [Candidatus Omnitrophota bacterium]
MELARRTAAQFETEWRINLKDPDKQNRYSLKGLSMIYENEWLSGESISGEPELYFEFGAGAAPLRDLRSEARGEDSIREYLELLQGKREVDSRSIQEIVTDGDDVIIGFGLDGEVLGLAGGREELYANAYLESAGLVVKLVTKADRRFRDYPIQIRGDRRFLPRNFLKAMERYNAQIYQREKRVGDHLPFDQLVNLLQGSFTDQLIDAGVVQREWINQPVGREELVRRIFHSDGGEWIGDVLKNTEGYSRSDFERDIWTFANHLRTEGVEEHLLHWRINIMLSDYELKESLILGTTPEGNPLSLFDALMIALGPIGITHRLLNDSALKDWLPSIAKQGTGLSIAVESAYRMLLEQGLTGIEILNLIRDALLNNRLELTKAGAEKKFVSEVIFDLLRSRSEARLPGERSGSETGPSRHDRAEARAVSRAEGAKGIGLITGRNVMHHSLNPMQRRDNILRAETRISSDLGDLLAEIRYVNEEPGDLLDPYLEGAKAELNEIMGKKAREAGLEANAELRQAYEAKLARMNRRLADVFIRQIRQINLKPGTFFDLLTTLDRAQTRLREIRKEVANAKLGDVLEREVMLHFEEVVQTVHEKLMKCFIRKIRSINLTPGFLSDMELTLHQAEKKLLQIRQEIAEARLPDEVERQVMAEYEAMERTIQQKRSASAVPEKSQTPHLRKEDINIFDEVLDLLEVLTRVFPRLSAGVLILLITGIGPTLWDLAWGNNPLEPGVSDAVTALPRIMGAVLAGIYVLSLIIAPRKTWERTQKFEKIFTNIFRGIFSPPGKRTPSKKVRLRPEKARPLTKPKKGPDTPSRAEVRPPQVVSGQPPAVSRQTSAIRDQETKQVEAAELHLMVNGRVMKVPARGLIADQQVVFRQLFRKFEPIQSMVEMLGYPKGSKLENGEVRIIRHSQTYSYRLSTGPLEDEMSLGPFSLVEDGDQIVIRPRTRSESRGEGEGITREMAMAELNEDMTVASADEGQDKDVKILAFLDPGGRLHFVSYPGRMEVLKTFNPDGSVAWGEYELPHDYTTIYPMALMETEPGEVEPFVEPHDAVPLFRGDLIGGLTSDPASKLFMGLPLVKEARRKFFDLMREMYRQEKNQHGEISEEVVQGYAAEKFVALIRFLAGEHGIPHDKAFAFDSPIADWLYQYHGISVRNFGLTVGEFLQATQGLARSEARGYGRSVFDVSRAKVQSKKSLRLKVQSSGETGSIEKDESQRVLSSFDRRDWNDGISIRMTSFKERASDSKLESLTSMASSRPGSGETTSVTHRNSPLRSSTNATTSRGVKLSGLSNAKTSPSPKSKSHTTLTWHSGKVNMNYFYTDDANTANIELPDFRQPPKSTMPLLTGTRLRTGSDKPALQGNRYPLSEFTVKALAIALFPAGPAVRKRVVTKVIDRGVIDSLVVQYRSNVEELEKRLLAETHVSEYTARLAVMNRLDAHADEIEQSFAIGAVIPEELDQRLMPAFWEGFLSGLDRGRVNELLKEGARLPRPFMEGLAKLRVPVRNIDTRRAQVLRGNEQAAVPLAFLGEKKNAVIHEMFEPLFIDHIEELKDQPEVLAWLGKLTSRVLMHLADFSEDAKLKTDPEKLKAELLRRLNLEDDSDLISITAQGPRMRLGIDSTVASLVYSRLIEDAVSSAA